MAKKSAPPKIVLTDGDPDAAFDVDAEPAWDAESADPSLDVDVEPSWDRDADFSFDIDFEPSFDADDGDAPGDDPPVRAPSRR